MPTNNELCFSPDDNITNYFRFKSKNFARYAATERQLLQRKSMACSLNIALQALS